VVSHLDHNAAACALLNQCALVEQVLGLQGFLVHVVSKSFEFLTLAREAAIVDLQTAALEHAHVGRYAHPCHYLHDVAHHDFLSHDGG